MRRVAARLEEERRILDQQEREIRRLRSSVSLHLGVHLTSAVRDPRKLALLPVTFPRLAVRLTMETLGRRRKPREPSPGSRAPASPDAERPQRGPRIRPEAPPEPRRHAIVLFPTNGVGFGHFTRLYAVARRLRARDPELEIVFFTPMPTLHIPYVEGFVTYHLAGRNRKSTLTPATWNRLVREMLTLVLEAHRPRWFLFDGAIPYNGMLDAVRRQPAMAKIWVRRGMLKDTSKIPARSLDIFDRIVHPGDAVPPSAPDPRVAPKTLQVSPITLIRPDEMWPRAKARSWLGVPAHARTVYVQLGAGRINDIDAEVRWVLDALLAHEDIHVVLGESMLGKRLDVSRERVHLLADYPNALYLKAFDASVQAGGYNSFHEMRSVPLPTLFLPNVHTGQDDQAARCRVAETEGWGVVNMKRSRELLRRDVLRLLALEVSGLATSPASGADEVSKHILSMDPGTAQRPRTDTRASRGPHNGGTSPPTGGTTGPNPET